MARAILTQLDNRDQAIKMGQRGRELALERFTWSNYLVQLGEVHRRVSGRDAAVMPTADRIAA